MEEDKSKSDQALVQSEVSVLGNGQKGDEMLLLFFSSCVSSLSSSLLGKRWSMHLPGYCDLFIHFAADVT